MRLGALILLVRSVWEYPHLLRTLSFWSALIGILLSYSDEKVARLLSLIALSVVGYGGLGVSYHRLAEMFGVPVEPVPIIRHAIRRDNFLTEKEELLSALWHAAFGVVGLRLLWKEIAKDGVR